MIFPHAVAAPITPTLLAVLREQGPELYPMVSGDMWREWRLKVRAAA